jgi:site-specific DNA recombinase
LIQATGAKDKLNQQLDRLDVTDRHYDRKYQDMQDRLDALYDRIADLEEKIDDVTDKISGAYDENLTSKQLCKVLLQFDEMFEEMTDLERKEFLYTLIERIDLFPERQENGSILKRIRFIFRVDYDAEAGDKVLLNENDVETVCLLSKLSEAKIISA